MSRHEVADVQRSLNKFTRKYLRGVNDLIVDGERGFATRRRIKWVKYYLGYGKKAGDNSAVISSKFVRSLRHPKDPRWNSARALVAGAKRRIHERLLWARNRRKASARSGVGQFDGVPVALWLIPYLEYARSHGWRGRLVSGWRDPKYSQSLCYRMCGAPSCPGKCAGLASNHVGSSKPRGAVDVSDYYRFGVIMRSANLSPHIYNALGAQDPVHFSASGR